ncbi:MAG: peptidoglycan editing factor PgeF [Thermaurantiacus sp.]|uniref:peptidoglycan editing factor PgeF n=1 Tax=Thermaurantiacus sp. TaxID=2820283 RepID=UPI00298F04FD|nr:peptidoglycan editing factor PgeF [Thermaurantiacus sp.]MDW8415242.1 peptidoglycan editing factor PgeF [Thermaurantiacus sp.]
MLKVWHAAQLKGVAHGFLGRQGGVSVGLYASLNAGLGSGDDPQAVARNRAIALAAVAPGTRLVTLRQVHSAVCHEAEAWAEDERPEGDALVTDRPGLALGVLTADCAPVLLADREAGVVGAAHAGWRGALAGVLEATVAAMERRGARRGRIAAAVGPAIGAASYEVGAEFHDRLRREDPASAPFFRQGPLGRPHFDLPGYVAHRLRAAGVGDVGVLALDTAARADDFFSHRRAGRRGEGDYGRQLSLIALEPPSAAGGGVERPERGHVGHGP